MKNIIEKLVIVWCMMMTEVTGAISDDRMQTNYYYMSVETQNISTVVGLNGVPIIIDSDGEGLMMDWPVNSWIMQGANTLDLVFKKLPNKDELQPVFNVKIYLADPDAETPRPKIVYTKIASEDFLDDKGKLELPVRKSIKFEFENKTPTKLWGEAKLLSSVSNSDKIEIIKLVNLLEKAMLDKDVDNVVALQKYKIMEDAMAENRSATEIIDAVKTNFKWLFDNHTLTGKPLSINMAEFIPCGGNKLIMVKRSNGNPAIYFETKEESIDIPVYVAKIHNEWMIVR